MDLFQDLVGNLKGDEPLLSQKYIDELLDLLPETIWNPETTFIDIACVDGSKLQAIYNRLDDALSKLPEYKDAYKRREHIVRNQLYGISLNSDNNFIISRRIFGEPFSEKVIYIEDYQTHLINTRYIELSQIIS